MLPVQLTRLSETCMLVAACRQSCDNHDPSRSCLKDEHREPKTSPYAACAALEWRQSVACQRGAKEDVCRVQGTGKARRAHLPREAVEELVEEEDHGEGDVLVEAVLDQAREAVVRQRAVHQQQPRQKPARGSGVCI